MIPCGPDGGPCFTEEHGVCHAVQGKLEEAYRERGKKPLKVWKGMGAQGADAESHWTYAEARESGVLAHSQAFPHCNSKCVREQLDAYHKKQCGFQDDTPLRSDSSTRGAGTLTAEQAMVVDSQCQDIRNITALADD